MISAALSWVVLVDVGFMHHDARIALFPWINSGDLQVSWALRVDTLTAVMLVVVNTISSLVHLYSIGYMDEDPYRPRFFAYLSLFTFAMLMLVTADNLVQLFFGWEGVGLMSYLLIGFWYQKPSANAAAIKAFVVNRVGDFGFALGIFAVFMLLNTTDFETIFAGAQGLSGKTIDFFGWHADALTLICLLLFMGAMGKSAQFLLHTWLPDAMEGPTPVSALIHAATMVTAGVFMVARLSPLFELAPNAQAVVMFFGATTAFFAATVGLVQNDIKRIVAYSTCSQLGYMFVAMGAGAFGRGSGPGPHRDPGARKRGPPGDPARPGRRARDRGGTPAAAGRRAAGRQSRQGGRTGPPRSRAARTRGAGGCRQACGRPAPAGPQAARADDARDRQRAGTGRTAGGRRPVRGVPRRLRSCGSRGLPADAADSVDADRELEPGGRRRRVAGRRTR